MGLGIFVFAKDRLKERITKVSCDTVKLGFMGKIANKVFFCKNKLFRELLQLNFTSMTLFYASLMPTSNMDKKA